MAGEASVRTPQEDLMAPEDTRKNETIAEIGCLNLPADRGFNSLTGPRS
jgi:hypothetical protein